MPHTAVGVTCSTAFQLSRQDRCACRRVQWRWLVDVCSSDSCKHMSYEQIDSEGFSVLDCLIWSVALVAHWTTIEYKIAAMTYKSRTHQQPSYFHEYIPVRTSLSLDRALLRVSSTKTATADRIFRVAVKTLWNNLPVAVRNSTSLYQVCRLLKVHNYAQPCLCLCIIVVTLNELRRRLHMWQWLIDWLIKKVKFNFEIYIADRKATTHAQLFLLRCVNPAALPLVRCYSIHRQRG